MAKTGAKLPDTKGMTIPQLERVLRKLGGSPVKGLRKEQLLKLIRWTWCYGKSGAARLRM
jgi:hypothetical protein